MGKINQFVQHIVPGVVRPLRVLWNEIIGFLFIVLAIWATPSAIRNLRAYNGDGETLFRAALPLVFALIMIYFGVSSFLRARKISRS
jgi:ABC-type arginine transport system permease subunit